MQNINKPYIKQYDEEGNIILNKQILHYVLKN